MEVPEKIYMTPSFGESDNVLLATFSKSHLNFHQDIEYVRTDAFIEKTEKYLQEHLIDYWSQVVTDESDFIENFKDYMKGE